RLTWAFSTDTLSSSRWSGSGNFTGAQTGSVLPSVQGCGNHLRGPRSRRVSEDLTNSTEVKLRGNFMRTSKLRPARDADEWQSACWCACKNPRLCQAEAT